MSIEEGSGNLDKRPIWFIFNPDGTFHVEPGLDPDALPREVVLSLKPKNSNLDDFTWTLLAGIYGIAGASAKMFTKYLKDETQAGRKPYIPSSEETPGMWEKTLLGQAGELGFRETAGNYEQFTDFMAQHEWQLEELGTFGNWMIKSGIDPRFSRAILDRYLKN